MAAVVIVFGLLIVGGLVLHQWGQRRAQEATSPREERDLDDLRDLADPDRWPAPPPGPAPQGPVPDDSEGSGA